MGHLHLTLELSNPFLTKNETHETRWQNKVIPSL